MYTLGSEQFKDFGNEEVLIWSKKGLIYENWSSGSVNGAKCSAETFYVY
jgi:hypothetical protein